MIAASSGRAFATFPAAVVVAIINRREELLLPESPRRPGSNKADRAESGGTGSRGD
jgi:hypothetical protein